MLPFLRYFQHFSFFFIQSLWQQNSEKWKHDCNHQHQMNILVSKKYFKEFNEFNVKIFSFINFRSFSHSSLLHEMKFCVNCKFSNKKKNLFYKWERFSFQFFFFSYKLKNVSLRVNVSVFTCIVKIWVEWVKKLV